jgi:UDP-2,3-diacylglucosamine pyrophosphatase LpxH
MKNSMLKITALVVMMLFTYSVNAGAHCDTMDGPVVKDAKSALVKGDVTLVLRWVRKEYEGEVRQAFQKTIEVRKKGNDAKELADMYFFETVVRLHRAGEGEPYTGLKPSGTPVEPIVQSADNALESGNIKGLAKQITSASEEAIVKRFQRAVETKKDANKSIEAGREYVEAYVEFVHYVEQLEQMVEGNFHHHAVEETHEDHK